MARKPAYTAHMLAAPLVVPSNLYQSIQSNVTRACIPHHLRLPLPLRCFAPPELAPFEGPDAAAFGSSPEASSCENLYAM